MTLYEKVKKSSGNARYIPHKTLSREIAAWWLNQLPVDSPWPTRLRDETRWCEGVIARKLI